MGRGTRKTEMKYRGGQRGIGASRGEDLHEVLRRARAARSDHGDGYRIGYSSCKLAIKSAAGTVPVHRGQQDFARAAIFGFPSPSQYFLAGALPSAGDIDFRLAGFCISTLRVNSDNHGLRPETPGDLLDQPWTCNRRRVNADLVGAGVEDLGRIVDSANAAANGEGNKSLPGSAANGIDESLAARGGGGDVEQNDFVGAGLGMSAGQLSRI